MVGLIALMLFVSFPKLSGFLTVNNRHQAIRWLIAQRLALGTRSVGEQKPYILRVDIDENRFTALSAAGPSPSGSEPFSTGDQPASAGRSQRTFVCRGGLKISGVSFPEGETLRSGTVEIVFSEKGYCSQAVIYMTDDDQRFSVYVAPFLPRVSVYPDFIQFQRRWKEWS